MAPDLNLDGPNMTLRPLFWLSLVTIACGEAKEEEGFATGGGSVSGADGGAEGGDGADGGDDTGDLPALQESCTTGEDPVEAEPILAKRITAEVTWNLAFDATAEADGYVDCSYTRTYEGLQVLDLDYTCPTCSVIVRGEATLIDGADCHAQINGGEAELTRTELWGIGDEGLTLYRAGRDQFPLGDLATFELPVVEGESSLVAWDSTAETDSGGVMELSAAGALTLSTDDSVTVTPPFGARAAPYGCGWECNDPGTLELDYTLEIGGTLPNVRLDDACGEAVDLWDFYGSYIVLDLSQPDCGPCQAMAQQEHEFIQEMRRKGIPVRVVTLMGVGLSYPYLTPEPEALQDWIDAFALTEPVLADRGYGYALFSRSTEELAGESFGYPTWAIIDPQMRLQKVSVGFGSFDPIVATIEALEAE